MATKNVKTKSKKKSAKTGWPKNISTAIGEYSTLAELLRKGYKAYLAQGPNQPGWDIVVEREDGKLVRVQVKAIDWPNQKAVNGKLYLENYDVLVIVLLNRSDDGCRYLVFPQKDAARIASVKSNKRKEVTINVTPKFYLYEKFEGFECNWDCLKTVELAT